MRLPVLLLSAACLAACATKHRSESSTAGAGSPPPSPKRGTASGSVRTNLNVTVTPGLLMAGRVASVNSAGRFVVLTFPLGTMPPPERRLNVYRGGLKVGEVKITGLPLDINVVADIMAGECRVGDEVKEE